MRDRNTIWQPEGKRRPPLPPARYPWRLTPLAIHAPLRLVPPRGPAQASDAVLERAAARHRHVSVDPQGEQVHDLIVEAVNDEDLEFWIDRDGSLVDGDYANEPWHEDWRSVQACALDSRSAYRSRFGMTSMAQESIASQRSGLRGGHRDDLVLLGSRCRRLPWTVSSRVWRCRFDSTVS